MHNDGRLQARRRAMIYGIDDDEVREWRRRSAWRNGILLVTLTVLAASAGGAAAVYSGSSLPGAVTVRLIIESTGFFAAAPALVLVAGILSPAGSNPVSRGVWSVTVCGSVFVFAARLMRMWMIG